MAFLMDTRQVVIHEKTVAVNPKTTFIATINEGVKYSGTFRLDEALRQRFDFFVTVDYPRQ
jgi:MoxR-like ATPase